MHRKTVSIVVATLFASALIASVDAAAQEASSIYRYDVQNATSAEPAITFMLDTATGACWEMLVDQSGRLAGMALIRITPAPRGRPGEIGRFRMITSGGKQTGTFILDTSNGHMWAWGVEAGRSFFALLPVEGIREK